MHSILEYDRLHNACPNDPAWLVTIKYMEDLFDSYSKVTAFNFDTQLKDVPFESDSSAGFAFGGLKGPPGEATHKRALGQANKLIRSLQEGETTIEEAIHNSVPDVGFTRTQLTYLPEKLKVRNVWGEHFSYILLEGLFAYPLMKFFSEYKTFIHIGEDPRISVPALLNRLVREESPYIYSLDWSNFDASVQRWEIELAFRLLERMLIFPNEVTRLTWMFVKELFMTRKVAAPDGNIYVKSLGVPSGSYFTMLIDSIVNFIRIMYIFKLFTKDFPREVETQGDDGIILAQIRQRLDLNYVAHYVKTKFNWILNPSKCGQGINMQELGFLSRTIFGSDNYRDATKLERLALYPEYEVTSGEISLFRVNSIIEESGTRSPALTFCRAKLKERFAMPTTEQVPRHFRTRFNLALKTV